ncbi:peptide chain release factor N(5)-glutamine methyltransferase [Yunchengibacter salinarum]|uniref:peptide chain release factor N(5)-glutamine methyltransferase n=1 Tax=Yunchengibacter salinarum TaxID=3133399 RepID=UPI0035B5D7BE
MRGLLKLGTARLKTTGIDQPRAEARLLLGHVLGRDGRMLELAADDPLHAPRLSEYEALLARRAKGEPVAYLTGFKAFYEHDFRVTPDTLIPRPDSETLVRMALDHLPMGAEGTIADMGTGSGCLLLSVLAARPGLSGVGSDISGAALTVAADNGARLGLADRARWLEGDGLAPLETARPAGGYALVLSNPPYIETPALAGLMRDVRDFEPRSALDGGPDGLSFYRQLAQGAPGLLAPSGLLAVEVGVDQAGPVAALFAGAGATDTARIPDLGGIDRVVCARF